MSSATAPLAMQLAARVEKLDPPPVADICAAAALATVALLSDPRSQQGGRWHSAVAAWNGQRIRKLVRRGRGTAWERAQQPEGVTTSVGDAHVRAYVPGPMDAVPEAVAKLQIQSTDLDAPAQVDAHGHLSGLIVAVTPLTEMSWGKQAAQCAHAAQRAWMQASPELRERWDQWDRPIHVLHPTPDLWAELHDLASTKIHDGGYTEIPAGTLTALAWWAEPFAVRQSGLAATAAKTDNSAPEGEPSTHRSHQ